MELGILEKDLNDYYKEVKKGENLGWFRRYFAYGLKLITGGAGLIVATGAFTAIDKSLGFAVLVAILLDSVFSNHLRLIAETEAGHAYSSLARKVRATFNGQKAVELALRKTDPEAANAKLFAMMQSSHEELSTGIDKIKERLAEADIKALRSLAHDPEDTNNG